MRIYIDTSVINGVFADDVPWVKQITENFFRLTAKPPFVIYISELVAAEIERTKDIQKRKQLIDVISKYSFEMLPATKEAQVLGEKYVKEKIIPAKYLPDAIHIATASVHNIPVLVSWNFSHIVKHQTRIKVNHINQRLGYPQIDICSPEEI
jgi:predicted nucleic acid-binding protein